MTTTRGPPKQRKLTPSHYPELDLPERWRQRYLELMATGDYNQTEALDQIAAAHNVSRPTVYAEVFPSYKQRQKERPSSEWSHQSSRPTFSRDDFNAARATAAKARYHVDDLCRAAYVRVENQPLELPQLSTLIAELSGHRFRPKTLLTLNASYAKTHGQPLLERIEGGDVPRYVLYTGGPR